jgi:hypothetical protein
MRQARTKILDKAQRKYLFEFEDRRVPTGLIVEDGHLRGLQMTHTEVIEGKARTLPNTQEPVRSALTVSSIGSIPEPVPGIPQKGEVYAYADQSVGLLMEGPTAIYAAGNVLTGKGNIKDSLDSGTEIGSLVAERYLGLADDGSRAPIAEGSRRSAHEEGQRMAASIRGRAPLAPDQVARIMERARERQRVVGYDGNYRAWIVLMTPPDLQ